MVSAIASLLFAVGPALGLDLAKNLEQCIHNVWQIEDGLPCNGIMAILQTQDGYLWLGTEDGLVRFDGQRFVIYDSDNTPAMGNIGVACLLEDNAGALWIGTWSGGIVVRREGIFSSFTVEDGLSNGFVKCMCQDTMGRVWVGTRGGLDCFEDGTFASHQKGNGLPEGSVTSLLADGEGGIWIGTSRKGLIRYQDGEYAAEGGLPDNAILSLCRDRQGCLWIGTYGGGLCKLESGQVEIFTPNDGIGDSTILTICGDDDGGLWIGTSEGGLNRFRQGTFDTFSIKDGLSHNAVWAILEDREGNLWVGTYGGGLNRLRDGPFTSFPLGKESSKQKVLCIHEDREGSIWIATEGQGVGRMRNGTVSMFGISDGLSHAAVSSMTEDAEGVLWLGTFGGGINRFQGGQFTSLNTRDGLPHDEVLCLIGDQLGNLWIGTSGGGIARFHDGEFTVFNEQQGLSDAIVLALTEGRDGSLWIGTYTGGLNRFKDGEFTVYDEDDGLSNNSVRCIYEDEQNDLWIGTYGGGLNRFRDGAWTIITTKNGLFDKVIYQVMEDDNGNLWMSSNRGIFRVHKQELNDFADGKIDFVTSTSYGKGDGLKSLECNGSGGYKTRNGQLWFPTTKGAVMVDPNNIKLNELPPPVYIEDVLVNDEAVVKDRIATGILDLKSGKSRCEFHYTALSFVAPKKVRFKYRLEGFEKEWIEAGTRRTAYYTNLPHGSYKFHVIACNNDGVWNEDGDSFEFDVQPRFHETYPFYGLCALGFILIGAGFFSLRVRQLKARQRELEGLVAQRTRQLETANQKLERLASLDGLTGIANRRSLDAMMEQEWKRALRSGQSLSMILIDIDFFKKYNDTYGHLQGDDCLKKVVSVLNANVRRAGDLVARYGGEEFAVLLPRMEAQEAKQLAEQLRAEIVNACIDHAGSQINDYVTLSLGVGTIIPAPDTSTATLIAVADEALYRAKAEGRNRVVVGE